MVLGLFFGVLFGKLIFRMKIYVGPSAKEVQSYIYTEDGKCYKMTPKVHICPSSISMK